VTKSTALDVPLNKVTLHIVTLAVHYKGSGTGNGWMYSTIIVRGSPLMGLGELVRSFWRNRSPISQINKHEIIGRYHGSVSGLLRPFLNLLPMLAACTFVFGVVFKARWNRGFDSGTEFATLRFVGSIIHRFDLIHAASKGIFRSTSVANTGQNSCC
jgi:hypothetical protein